MKLAMKVGRSEKEAPRASFSAAAAAVAGYINLGHGLASASARMASSASAKILASIVP